jgi:hypothetical protein
LDGQYEIAEIMGWEEEYVHKIIRRYVGPNGALLATIAKPWQGRRTNRICKTASKLDRRKSPKCWSGRRESNPRMQLGKLPFYH